MEYTLKANLKLKHLQDQIDQIFARAEVQPDESGPIRELMLLPDDCLVAVSIIVPIHSEPEHD